MTLDLGRLQRLAEQATPGPWRVYDHRGPWPIWRDNGEGTAPIAEEVAEWADAAFIAEAGNPKVVLALVERVRDLEATVERLNPGLLQDDLREILDALGLGTHARPKSPHQVFQDEVLPALKRRLRRKRNE